MNHQIYSAIFTFGLTAMQQMVCTSIEADTRDEAIEKLFTLYPETKLIIRLESEQQVPSEREF